MNWRTIFNENDELIEKKLNNSIFSEELFLKAQDLIKNDFSPIDDMRASRNYRIEIARNLLMKFFYEISTRSKIRINWWKVIIPYLIKV